MPPLTATWQELKQAAERARRGGAHEQAIGLYTQALVAAEAGPDIPWEACCAMMLARAASREALGQPGIETELATLEHRLAERTAQLEGPTAELQRSARELQAAKQSLEQRNSELAILNSLGEAMAQTLDVKTVARIVGDKLRDIFDADTVMIMLLDAQTSLIHGVYEYDPAEGGYVDYVEPFPLGTGLSSQVISIAAAAFAEHAGRGSRAWRLFPPGDCGTRLGDCRSVVAGRAYRSQRQGAGLRRPGRLPGPCL